MASPPNLHQKLILPPNHHARPPLRTDLHRSSTAITPKLYRRHPRSPSIPAAMHAGTDHHSIPPEPPGELPQAHLPTAGYLTSTPRRTTIPSPENPPYSPTQKRPPSLLQWGLTNPSSPELGRPETLPSRCPIAPSLHSLRHEPSTEIPYFIPSSSSPQTPPRLPMEPPSPPSSAWMKVTPPPPRRPPTDLHRHTVAPSPHLPLGETTPLLHSPSLASTHRDQRRHSPPTLHRRATSTPTSTFLHCALLRRFPPPCRSPMPGCVMRLLVTCGDCWLLMEIIGYFGVCCCYGCLVGMGYVEYYVVMVEMLMLGCGEAMPETLERKD